MGVCETDTGGVRSTLGSANTYAYSRGLGKFALVGNVGDSTCCSNNVFGCVTAWCASVGSVC